MNWAAWKASAKVALLRGLRRVARRVPPGWRIVVGVLMIFGGFLGFLPVLGFWMIPLGILVAALDVRPMRRRWRARRALRAGQAAAAQVELREKPPGEVRG